MTIYNKQAYEDWVVANPCPFCGSEYITVYNKDFFEKHHVKKVLIRCKACGGMIESDRNGGNYEGAFENVLGKWNRRPGDGTDGQ